LASVRFEVGWRTWGPVEHVAKPYGSQFERLRAAGWSRDNWPKGGLYVYEEDPGSLGAIEEGQLVVLTSARVPELVNELVVVDTDNPASVCGFLSRWGLLAVGVPRREERRGNAIIFTAPPSVLKADSAKDTHAALEGLKQMFLAGTYEQRLAVAQRMPTVAWRMHPVWGWLELLPTGPVAWHAQVEPFAGLLMAALSTAPFRTCPVCGTLFPAGSQDKQFCSTRCRVQNFRKEQKKGSKRRRSRR
jgi:predicted nucleic acid-binding Zn ribbon protein